MNSLHVIMFEINDLCCNFSRGQLGHGDTQNVDEPKIIEALQGITMVKIAGGGWHSVAISGEGSW